MHRSLAVIALTATALVATAVPALAHASFDVTQLPVGATAAFVLRVPVERDVPNERVEVLVPGGWTVTSCDGAEGWTCSVEASGDDSVLALVREPDGDGQLERFAVSMTAPTTEGVYAFPAVQTYTDGEEAAWIGEAGTDHPAPRIQVGDATTPVERAEAPAHDDPSATPSPVAVAEPTPQPSPRPTPASSATATPTPTPGPSATPAPDDSPQDDGGVPVGPVVAAVVLAAVAALVLVRRRAGGSS